MGTSSIVFFEPALADVLMLGVIIAVPVLGSVRFGRLSLLNLALWLGIVGLGLAATLMSTTTGTAVTHQLVTLFLACFAFVLAGFVAEDPEARFRLIMTWYVAACLIATVAALAGYFHLFPSAYDLLTNYGRARGTFKDPNVYGAALVPALVYCIWVMLRESKGRALIAAAASLLFVVGLLISFSRGAWVSAALSLAILGWVAVVTGRRKSDRWRFACLAVAGSLACAAALIAALQTEAVQSLIEERASLEQSYDTGPDGRFGGQAQALSLILEHPLGIGTFTFSETYHDEDAHNVYLTMALNAGWLGGLLYIISVAMTLLFALKGTLRLGALQGPFLVAGAALTGAAFEGLVIDSDHWRHFFILMGVIWGLADAAAPVLDSARRRSDPIGVAWARIRPQAWAAAHRWLARANRRQGLS